MLSQIATSKKRRYKTNEKRRYKKILNWSQEAAKVAKIATRKKGDIEKRRPKRIVKITSKITGKQQSILHFMMLVPKIPAE